jgi:hypothetical protein
VVVVLSGSRVRCGRARLNRTFGHIGDADRPTSVGRSADVVTPRRSL